MIDTSKTERIHPNYWMNCQLSIARHYGRINIQGVEYIVGEGNFLIRWDIWEKEKKQKKNKEVEERKQMKAKQNKMF